MDNLVTKIDGEIESLTEGLHEIDATKQEYSTVAKNIETLIKCRNDLVKPKDEKITKIIEAGVETVGVVAKGLIMAYGIACTFDFDREHTPTSTLGRGFLNKFVPKW